MREIENPEIRQDELATQLEQIIIELKSEILELSESLRRYDDQLRQKQSILAEAILRGDPENPQALQIRNRLSSALSISLEQIQESKAEFESSMVKRLQDKYTKDMQTRQIGPDSDAKDEGASAANLSSLYTTQFQLDSMRHCSYLRIDSQGTAPIRDDNRIERSSLNDDEGTYLEHQAQPLRELLTNGSQMSPAESIRWETALQTLSNQSALNELGIICSTIAVEMMSAGIEMSKPKLTDTVPPVTLDIQRDPDGKIIAVNVSCNTFADIVFEKTLAPALNKVVSGSISFTFSFNEEGAPLITNVQTQFAPAEGFAALQAAQNP